MKDNKLFGLYGITDPGHTPDDRLLQSVEAALEGGMRILQYRNKAAKPGKKYEQAKALKNLCKQHGALFLVNDDLELCLDVDADGLHIGQSDGCAQKARGCLGPDKILGITCHNRLDLAHQAIAEGANYVAFGSMFASNTKPLAVPCSLETLSQATQLGVPVVAIGGIALHNADQAIAAGADMIAVIEGLFGHQNVYQQARSFTALFS